jgi:hypothetical protein
MAESRELGQAEAALADEAEALEDALRQLLLRIPNLPSEQAPDGSSEADNPIVKGPVNLPDAYPDHQRVPHWESATALGILDNERAAKISGTMFTMPRGLGATLSARLCQLALDRNADAFEEIRPPTLVTTATLTATGQLPKFADDSYLIVRDDLWCIPTAEVPLTSLAAGEILDEEDLPVRMMASTACYRREAGSAGRDTRGMLRSPRVRQGGGRRLRHPRAGAGHARRADRPRRVDHRGARVAVPHHRDLHPQTWGRATTAASTSRSTRRVSTRGSRSPRSAGSATTRPAGPTCATGRWERRERPSCTPSTGRRWPVPRVWAAPHREQPAGRRQHRAARGAVALPARAP